MLSRRGDPAAFRLLADKVATEDLLAAHQLLTPTRFAVHTPPQADLALAVIERHDACFIKPRVGRASQHTFGLEQIHPHVWRAGDGVELTRATLLARLAALPVDQFIVQEQLKAVTVLSEFAGTTPPPVLRLTTACRPGGAPFLYSALWQFPVPHTRAQNFLRGWIHAPVRLGSGRLCAGVLLAEPDRRVERLPWNNRRLVDAELPIRAAIDAALRAMTLLPPIPLVCWDIVVTDRGPVILEGNSSGNWVLTNLSGVESELAVPILSLLAEWR